MNQYVPKEITEEVNVTPTHPLVNLGYLLVTVVLAGALIYGGLGLIASQIVARMGPETEEKIGATITSSLTSNSDNTDRRVEYLNGLLEELQEQAQQQGQPPPAYPPLKVYILDTPVENAMVAAGSYVFVTEGLLAAAQSENELAFVLAHELGHLQNRDPLKALERSLVWMTLSSLLGIGQVQLPGVVTNAANFSELSYSRNQETIADDYAVNVIMERYEHGDHSLDFFERAQDLELDLGAFKTVAEWGQTHPMSSDRITRIENTFTEKSWPLTGEPTALPKNLGCQNFNPCQ